MKNGSLAILPFEQKFEKDTDGEDGDFDNPTFQVTIDVVDNGFVYTLTSGDEIKQKVFIFDGSGDSGPHAMIKTLLDDLGISDKVKVQR